MEYEWKGKKKFEKKEENYARSFGLCVVIFQLILLSGKNDGPHISKLYCFDILNILLISSTFNIISSSKIKNLSYLFIISL